MFKYIILEIDNAPEDMPDHKRFLPVIFSPVFVHSDMADLARHNIMMEKNAYTKVVSAGFLDLIPRLSCYGRSESLDINSRPEDVVLLADIEARGLGEFCG